MRCDVCKILLRNFEYNIIEMPHEDDFIRVCKTCNNASKPIRLGYCEGCGEKEPICYCDCEYCEGRGYTIYSCCGDDITANIGETDICPQCYEHCGDEKEPCEECQGTKKDK